MAALLLKNSIAKLESFKTRWSSRILVEACEISELFNECINQSNVSKWLAKGVTTLVLKDKDMRIAKVLNSLMIKKLRKLELIKDISTHEGYKKEREKIEKYQDLKIEIKRI